jgi:hypothetical protein
MRGTAERALAALARGRSCILERMETRRLGRATAIVTAALGCVLLAPAAVAVDDDQVGVVAAWEVSGSSGAFTATAVLPASAGFPATTLESTSRTLAAPSGESAFLGASTAFGTEFGSTRSHPYLSIAPTTGGGNSLTTLTFAGAQPDGWAFALGDIDADWAFIQAFGGPGGTDPLTPDELGFMGAGNYCDNSPRPSTCGAGPYTDAPVWVTAPELFDGINYAPGTLRGNSLPGAPGATRDTSGAYGWFMPTRAITSLQIMFGVRDGSPTAQMWLATPAPKVTVTGQVEVEGAGDGAVPAGTVIAIADDDGDALLGLEDEPLTVPVDPATGTYVIDLPQSAEGYQGTVVVPEGYIAPPPFALPGVPDNPDSVEAAAPLQVIAAAETPEPEPSGEPTPSPTPTATAGAGPVADLEDEDVLADSGPSQVWTAVVAAVLIVAGLAIVRRVRLR